MAKVGEPQERTRTLLYIPIIHTRIDMGALGESVQRLNVRKLGRTRWRQAVDLVDQMWTEIEHGLESWTLSYDRVRIYQDGLSLCGCELRIVTELAKAGSRNHRLLLRLKDKGATIMGTESPELLVEEHRFMTQVLAPGDTRDAARAEARQKALSRSLIERRDQYIAARINKTLQGGETGILFLGMLHSVAGRLDRDIQVTYPIHRPPEVGARKQ